MLNVKLKLEGLGTLHRELEGLHRRAKRVRSRADAVRFLMALGAGKEETERQFDAMLAAEEKRRRRRKR